MSTSPEKPPANFPPKDWGRDELGKFLEDAHYNTIASFANLRPHYDSIAKLDSIFRQLIEPKPSLDVMQSAFFLHRTHASYRGAAGLALSGRIPEAHMLLRGCLESALYGLYVLSDERFKTWVKRNDDADSLRKMKTEFKIINLMQNLESVDSKTQKITHDFYERTIDYGAHPNQRGLLSHVKFGNDDSRLDIISDYFIVGNVQQMATLRFTAQIGICCLDIFYHVFRDRYRLLGIDRKLDEIRVGF